MRSYYKPRSVRRLEKKGKQKIIFTVIGTIILIYFLITWGLPALIGGLSVLNKTSDTKQKQGTIQEDITLAPPVLNIPFEATNTATIKITGYTTPNAKVEIYVDGDIETTAESDSSGNFQTDPISLLLGTNEITGKTIDEKNKRSLPSKTIKVTYNNEKPKLEIHEPEDGKKIQGGDKKVKISGLTDPQNLVSINGSTVILNAEGRFFTELSINEGENTLVIVAANSVGNKTQIERKVTYQP